MAKKTDIPTTRKRVFEEVPPSLRPAADDIFIRALCIDDGDRDDFATAPIRRFNSFLLSHIYAGCGRLWLSDGREFRLEEGATVLLPPGTDNLCGAIAGTGYREDYMLFDGTAIRRMLELGLIKSGVGRLGTVRRLPELNRALRDSVRDAEWRAGLQLQSLLLEINRNDNHSGRPSRLALLLEVIRDDRTHWWTLAEMAEFCHQSEAQFRRCFVKSTGMNPKHFIEEDKLREAARNLVESSQSIESIADSLGYRDRFHFSSRFKLFFGLAPAQYREANPGR